MRLSVSHITSAFGITAHQLFPIALLKLTLVVLFPIGVLAQDSSEQEMSASINVTGRVVAELAMQSLLIESVYDPSFQQVDIDVTRVIVDPVTNKAGSGGGAGMLVAKGEPGRDFQVVIPEAITLINSETGTTLDVRVIVSHNGIIDQSSSDYVRDAISGFRLNGDGEYYFWLGGEIDVAEVEEGDYEGSFLLEVEYI